MNDQKELNRKLYNTKLDELNIPKKALKELKSWGITRVGSICNQDVDQIEAMSGKYYRYVLGGLVERGITIDIDTNKFVLPEPTEEELEYNIRMIKKDIKRKFSENEENERKRILNERKRKLLEQYKVLLNIYNNLEQDNFKNGIKAKKKVK